MTTKSREDTDFLLSQARRGDAAAANRLLTRHQGRLRKMVRFRMDQRLSRRFDPSDVVQETMIVAARKLVEYFEQPQVDFYPWLRDIAWKRLVDLHRRHVLAERRSVEREIEPPLTDASATQLAKTLAAADSEPWMRVSREDLRQKVRIAMSQLKPDAREVLVLRFVEQLTAREAAQVMGISESALKGRQVRALEKLRSVLEEVDES